jgi:hypothetical protein
MFNILEMHLVILPILILLFYDLFLSVKRSINFVGFDVLFFTIQDLVILVRALYYIPDRGGSKWRTI